MDYFVTFFELLFRALYFLIIGRFVLSWIDPGGQWRATQLVNEMTEPVLAPLRRIIPSVGMFDLSPMVALLLLSVLQQLIGGLR